MSIYHYNFETNWMFEADIEQIWGLINEFNYGEWWKGLDSKRIKNESTKIAVGDRFMLFFHTKLPYQLAFESEVVKLKSPTYLEIKAFGELIPTKNG